MIRTLILSFNSSVWLHLTLYIAWEQPNIPQHSSILACWDTLHLPAAIQGPKGSTKAKKNPTLHRFPFCICGSQPLIFLGGAESGGEVVRQALFIPKWFPHQPKSQLGRLELEFTEGERICFAFLKEPGDAGWFLGVSRICITSPPPIPTFGPQIKPPSEATPGVRINTQGWACGI